MTSVSVWGPLELRCGLSLPHRFTLAPMTTDSANTDGTASAAELAYIARRAANGFALTLTSCAYVHPDGRAWRGIGATDEQHVASLGQVAGAFECAGSVRVLQLYDGGRLANPRIVGASGVRAPSAVASSRPHAPVPRALSSPEIDELVDAFADAAVRGVAAGFDGIELHGANHYLIHQFLSPRSNRRDDRWGGSPSKRMAFAIDLVTRVRAAIGPRVVLGFRISPFEVEKGGFTIDASTGLVDQLCQLSVDYVHISMDDFRKNSPQPEDRDWSRGVATGDGRSPVDAIAEVVAGRCAVIASGGINDIAQAQRAIDLGADLVAVGRAALIDPEWLTKIRRGADGKVRRLLPARIGDIESTLTVPRRMAEYLLSRPGWIPTETPLERITIS